MLIGTDTAEARGSVQVDAGAGRFVPVSLEMLFSEVYPGEPPDVRETGGLWVPTVARHMYPKSGHFCFGLPGVDLPLVATPDDFERFLDQVLVFLHDQFTFDAAHNWPGEEWEHDYVPAFTQFVCETLEISTEHEARSIGPLVNGRLPRSHDRCPCGSALTFARCHEAGVKRVRSVRRLREVPDLVERMVRRVNAESSLVPVGG